MRINSIILLFGILAFFFLNCSHHSDDSNPFPAPSPDASMQGDGSIKSPILLNNTSDWFLKSQFDRGFLHSTATFSLPLMQSLGPTAWRLGDLDAVNDIKIFTSRNTLNMFDLYTKMVGNSNPQPWNDWAGFEAKQKQIVQYAIDHNITVTYWEILSEPDAFFPAGRDDLFYEYNRRSISAIRALQPDAKIVGFSFSSYNLSYAQKFINFISSEGLKIDAIAWHEFGDPSLVSSHVDSMRALLALKNLNLEIHINEFIDGAAHLIPGWNLAFLSSLLQSKINWSSRACWDRTYGPSPLSECVSGLDGLLSPDNLQVTKIGALYQAINRMSGDRVHPINVGPGAAAILSFDLNQQKGSLMIGTYSCGQTGLWCKHSSHQVSDLPIADQTFKVYLKADFLAAKIIKFQKASLKNENLELAYTPESPQQSQATANPDGLIEISSVLQDGEVQTIDFSF